MHKAIKINRGMGMIEQMKSYYYRLVSHTGRFLTMQMIWWAIAKDNQGNARWMI